MKKARLKKIIFTSLAVCALAVPTAVTPVFANSGPRREYGVASLGTVVMGEQSALAVESEQLTFNLNAFPYVDGQTADAQSTVTAEYKFVNVSENTVHTTMAFPMEGSLASYMTDEESNFDHCGETEITVDGKAVEFEVRHTYGDYSNFNDSVQKLGDEYYQTDFFKPDKEVTKVAVTVDLKSYESVYCMCDIKYLSDKARVAGTWENGEDSAGFHFTKEQSGSVTYSAKNDDERCIYIIGDPSAVQITWRTEVYDDSKYSYKLVDLPVNVTMSDTTLLGALKEIKGAREAISDLDWYNAVVREMDSCAGQSIPRSVIEPNTSDFIEWFVYDVTVAPKGRISNKVTAVIYPSVYHAYDPYLYEYKYLISPASCWAGFGTLTVNVNTEYYMCNATKGFERAEGGYSAEFSSLPNGEIEFSLCKTDNPKVKDNFGTGMAIIFLILLCPLLVGGIASITVVILYLKKHNNKRQ